MKENFAFIVSELEDYTNENTGLIAAAVYKAKTIASGIEVLPGQKGNVKLNRVNHTLSLQAAACGWDPSGSTALDQVDVAVNNIDYKESLCPKTLEPKWFGQLMKNGSNPEDFPFSQYIVDTKSEKLSAEIEYMFWQGNETGSPAGTGNLALADGIIQALKNSGEAGDTKYVSGAANPTVSDIVDKVNLLIANSNETAYETEDMTLYMSVALFRTYVTALINENLFNYAQSLDGKSLEFYVPGHNIRVIGTSGLRGLDLMFLTPASNIVFATDLLDETEQLEMWWSRDNQEIRISGSFKFGVGVYFPALVTHNDSDIQ
jgi:hypothetical protein